MPPAWRGKLAATATGPVRERHARISAQTQPAGSPRLCWPAMVFRDHLCGRPTPRISRRGIGELSTYRAGADLRAAHPFGLCLCFMPDHTHLELVGTEDRSSLPEMLREFK